MVEKIWGFMARNVHKAILDMHDLGLNKQLEICRVVFPLGQVIGLH